MNVSLPSSVARSVFVALAGLAVSLCGTLALAQPQFSVLHHFNGNDGFGPMAGVVEGPDGVLYGTTSQGGLANYGTVFRLDRSTLSLTTLHDFGDFDGSLLYSGLTWGADGMLYGSTYAGGAGQVGTLFRLDTAGNGFESLANFPIAGSRPDDLQLVSVASDGQSDLFFGTTSEGGTLGGGTIFSLDTKTRAVAMVYEFPGPAGVDAGLVRGRMDGLVYGTTYSGGANGMGSVFRFDVASGTLIPLHDFTGSGGAYPVPGSLMQASDGNLYGTTQMGGNGTVYKIDLQGALPVYSILHQFSGTMDGRAPLGGLTEAGDGYLYGTTVLGGQGYGTVYRVNPANAADYSVVVRFGNSNGRSPSGNLSLGRDGSLFGVTRVGGSYNVGTVYRLSFDTTPPTINSIQATPNVLRPANGKMVAVTVNVQATDNDGLPPKCKIIGVSCNQAASGDWQITGDLTVDLRAKTAKNATRVYTITVQCTDSTGNSTTGTVSVTVPK